MWSSHLFWKQFLAYAGLILLALIACVEVVSSWQEEQLIDQVRRRLHDSASLVRDHLGDRLLSGRSEELQQKVRTLGIQTQTRFTLTAGDGTVIADSGQPTLSEVARMENHSNRKEFVQAYRTGEGVARRASPTLGDPFLYYALAIKKGEKTLGYVRAAQPVTTIQEEVASIRKFLWSFGMVVGFVCLAITYYLTRRIVRPIQELTISAENTAAGEYSKRVHVESADELGTLARSFEHMNRELLAREKQLRESSQRQGAVLGGMVEGVLAVDDQQHVLFANQAAGQALSFDPKKAEGLPLLEVVRSHDLRQLVSQTLESDQMCRGEMQWQTDTARTLDVHATPLPGEPCPGVVLVLHDITEIKKLEGLRQQFVSNVSHELKTPLSSIKAYTETLLNGALEDGKNARRFLKRIDDQANRLQDLILDMLSLARIETGGAIVELVDIPLERIVSRSISDHEAQAQSAQITLHNIIGPSETMVSGDEEALLQIFGNLLDNAIKYTPAGGTVTVRCSENLGNAEIEFIDTGIGIAPEHHERLFERFYRADKARSRELGGTGLGLSIVKHLCQAMGGSVSVLSELGKGSTFTVRIPLDL